MSVAELTSDKLNKINIVHRASLRGLKKCSCGQINGQRTVICRNISCELRKHKLAEIKPFDPIQLNVESEEAERLYSLRTNERLLNTRNFVKIASPPNRKTFFQKAISTCYVDGCKLNTSSVFCKHIKACSSLDSYKQKAENYTIDENILWNLNISSEQKRRLWDLYQQQPHPIQRLNSSIFVVACGVADNFPVGFLHATVIANSVSNKKGFYSCACKKLKIIVEPDNSIVMKKEICDHLILILAAILNKSEGKAMYTAFLDSLQHLWMPTTLNTPVESSTHLMDDYDIDMPLTKCQEVIKNKTVESPNTDYIFNFSEELFGDINIPDFSDIILDVNSEKLPSSTVPTVSPTTNSVSQSVLHIKDAKLNAINDDDLDFNFTHATSPELTTSIPINFNENSLSVIEQFQLNDNIQVSTDNIALANDIEILNNLETTSQLIETANGNTTYAPPVLTSTVVETQKNVLVDETNTVIIKPKNSKILINKSVIVKQSPVKIIKITSPGVIQKLPRIDKKFVQISKIDSSKLILLNAKCSEQKLKIQPINNLNVSSTVPSPPLLDGNCQNTVPSLSYESWLDHIIEILNDSIILQDTNNIKHNFHVHENMFTHFSETFGFNNKRKLPNFTSIIKSGKHKGLVKYGWYFNQAAAVKRIFSTQNSKIELQRSSEPLKEGSFVPFFPKLSSEITVTKYRPILPKTTEPRVFIKFSNAPETALDNNECEKYGLKLEWIPSAFPKSHFGLMSIEFCVYTYTKNSAAQNGYS